MHIRKIIGIISASVLMLSGGISFPEKSMKASAASDVSVMEPTDSTYDFIKELEGFSAECHWDVNQWTIGYGTKCPFDHPTNGQYQQQKGGHTVTEEQARELCSDIMGYFVGMVRSNCAGLSMEQNQFDALLSACYNHGNVNACPLKYYLQGTLTAEEARAQYEEWYIGRGGMYEAGLRARRKKEADLFFGSEAKTEVVKADCNCSEDYAGTYTTLGVTTYLNLRSDSSHDLTGAVIGMIYPGERFIVTKANGTIAHVIYNGTNGVVSMEYIQRCAPETTSYAAADQGADSDVNGDSIVDGRDATEVLTEYARTSAGKTAGFTSAQNKAADANGDSIVDGRDASIILAYYARQSVK